MSEIRFGCPHCGQRIEGDAAYRGKEIVCPGCQKPITVPSPAPRVKAGEPLKSAAQPSPSEPRLSALALVSLVCSFGLAAGCLPAIVLGHLARRRIRRDPALRGTRVALAGLLLGYLFLFASIAILTTAFFGLRPRGGHQLTQQEQAANTPALLASRTIDEVKIADPASEQTHQLQVRWSRAGIYMDRGVREAMIGGGFSYRMKVDSARPMSLFCTFWGNDSSGRRFDVLVNDTVIATQVLDFNDPGHFFDVEYRIPKPLTAGQSTVTVTFQAYPEKTAGGLYGCRMLARSGG